MILSYQYRLHPNKAQHAALNLILEAQRELYNAALVDRKLWWIKTDENRSLYGQYKLLTQARIEVPEMAALPSNLQRATLKRVDEAYKGFFRRAKKKGTKAGFPRSKGKGWFKSFGFSEFSGIRLKKSRLYFKGLPGSLRVNMHRPLPIDSIKSYTFKKDTKGWMVSFAVEVAQEPKRSSVS